MGEVIGEASWEVYVLKRGYRDRLRVFIDILSIPVISSAVYYSAIRLHELFRHNVTANFSSNTSSRRASSTLATLRNLAIFDYQSRI